MSRCASQWVGAAVEVAGAEVCYRALPWSGRAIMTWPRAGDGARRRAGAGAPALAFDGPGCA